MGRAETLTLLPLDRYAELMRIDPSHFNQLEGAKAPMRSGCDDVWDQDDREALAWTMAQAEEMIAHELGYWPAPKFFEQEDIPFNLPGVRSDWQNAEIETEWGHVQSWGTELLTLVMADAYVTYLNLDGDKYDREETAVIGSKVGEVYGETIPVECQPCEVALFFREQDGAWDPADPRWEIRPIKVDIDQNLLYITAESSLFVKPSLWDLTKYEDPDNWEIPFDVTNLVSQVDVYCRTVSLRTPVTLKWDGICGCNSQPCSHYTNTACAYCTDNKRGFFVPRPATWNGTANVYAVPTYSTAPESVFVNYRAGYPTSSLTCRMDPKLERAIVKLTNVLLPEPPCGYCDAAQRLWELDRLAVDPLTPEAASMPWDLYSRGALEAWRIVKRLAMGRGGKMGRGYR